MADSLQDPRFYNYVLRYTPLQWIIADEFMNSNREMMLLEKDLPLLESKLDSYRGSAALIQGAKDILVDPQSVSYLKAKLPQADVHIWKRENMNHFIIWSDKDLVLDALRWLQER